VAAVRVGIFAQVGPFAGDARQRKATLAQIADARIDHVCVGDHVSFFVAAGADALINATALLTHCPELSCYVALHLLPLRHPVPVARQLASTAELAPGRLTLGVGIGGEDRHELEICGVDPSSRGRRTPVAEREQLDAALELAATRPTNTYTARRKAARGPAPKSGWAARATTRPQSPSRSRPMAGAASRSSPNRGPGSSRASVVERSLAGTRRSAPSRPFRRHRSIGVFDRVKYEANQAQPLVAA
jgi:alkanesulfonate monooxygenase SsuD/methylene tetrahydromethanopterin reductase-like flavin-dependent oxidoreductase (luciferase family)